jgi:cyclophilin family peptidyl-prolyl cis-trans isomerase
VDLTTFRYTCFGYVVKNADLLKGVKEGDVIKSAKVTKGNDKLVVSGKSESG